MANTYPRKPGFHALLFPVEIPDISTADQRHIAPGFSGKIVRATSCLGGAITGSDADLTLKISGTAVTGGVITVATSSSAAGDIDTAIPTGANTFTATDHIEVETDGASSGAQEVVVTLELEPV